MFKVPSARPVGAGQYDREREHGWYVVQAADGVTFRAQQGWRLRPVLEMMSGYETLDALLPRVDVEQASRHLELLHAGASPDQYASLVLLAQNRHECHGFTAVERLWTPAEDPDESAAELQDVVDGRWNVYTACACFTEVPEKGRGRESDVASLPGVWCDLDVKPNSPNHFWSEAELLEYARCLPTPTLDVASGTGGHHLYWLVHTDERPNLRAGKDLLQRWRAYLLARAGGIALDNVQDAVRVLRLAGTVRWPKAEEPDVEPAKVTIVSEGPRYPLDELKMISQDAWDELVARRRTQRDRDAVENERLHAARARYGDTRLREYTALIAEFNARQDWARLLEPDGWTLYADHRASAARCRYWTRPGKRVADGKSASTDWTDDDGLTHNTMTLYTREPSLADISEVETGDGQLLCTKWYYAKTRTFKGDETELLRAVRDTGVLP